MQAVILCGGLGTRLLPVTSETPKAMVSVLGKPFLEYEIAVLEDYGVKEVVLCSGHLSSVIESFFEKDFDSKVKIRFSHEKKPLGTGGALRNARKFIKEDFLFLNGDTFINLDYRDVFERFKALGVLALMVVRKADSDVYSGNVDLSTEDFVLRYEGGAGLNFIDAGVSVFSKRIFDFFPEKQVFALEEEVYPQLAQSRGLSAYLTSKPFFDIGTPQGLSVFKDYLGGG
ncbi:MAG: sugar phosphate nucleotidyltransferase [Methanobacteriota archaeon]